MFQIGHVSLTSADTLWFLLFSSSFPKSACPTQAIRRLWCFCDFQSFFQLENLGSHLAMCPDDRFLPQGKQILPEICQVRPMPFYHSRHFSMSTFCEHIVYKVKVLRNLNEFIFSRLSCVRIQMLWRMGFPVVRTPPPQGGGYSWEFLVTRFQAKKLNFLHPFSD